MLFTKQEKLDAYRRITTCSQCMGDHKLSHTIRHAPETIHIMKVIGVDEGTIHKSNVLYRLVMRGMIVTMDQYHEKSKLLFKTN